MNHKELFSAMGIVLTLIAYLPYIYSIIKAETKPHVFSWLIWGSTTFIVFLAQLSDGGGLGAWVIGVSGIMVMSIAVLAYLKRADISMTHIDWAFLGAAIIALAIWYINSDPLWTVVILTLMNVIGFGPTIVKAYSHPFDENLTLFTILVPRNLLSVIALEHYSLTTVFFPIVTAIACLVLIAVVLYRRRVS